MLRPSLDKGLYSVSETSKILYGKPASLNEKNKHRQRIYRMIWRGQIKSINGETGGEFQISAAEISKYLAANSNAGAD